MLERNLLQDKISVILRFCTSLAAFITLFLLAFAVSFVLVKGLPYVSPELFSLHATSQNCSLVPALFNTAQMLFMALFFAIPVATAAAVFSCEYASKRLCALLCTVSETIASLPSVVFGLFGMLFFCITCRLGYSLASGAFTIALMLFPTIFDSVRRGIGTLPEQQRSGALALGSDKVSLIAKIILPHCAKYLVSGCSLAAARVFAESAALIFTCGTANGYATPRESGRTLAVHIYCLAAEGASIDKSYACAAVLLILGALLSMAAQSLSEITKSEHSFCVNTPN